MVRGPEGALSGHDDRRQEVKVSDPAYDLVRQTLVITIAVWRTWVAEVEGPGVVVAEALGVQPAVYQQRRPRHARVVRGPRVRQPGTGVGWRGGDGGDCGDARWQLAGGGVGGDGDDVMTRRMQGIRGRVRMAEL
jgi:hypothetical protein